jgi:hypothetical protein
MHDSRLIFSSFFYSSYRYIDNRFDLKIREAVNTSKELSFSPLLIQWPDVDFIVSNPASPTLKKNFSSHEIEFETQTVIITQYSVRMRSQSFRSAFAANPPDITCALQYLIRSGIRNGFCSPFLLWHLLTFYAVRFRRYTIRQIKRLIC